MQNPDKPSPLARPEISPETRREIVKWIVQAVLGLILYGFILFLSAGRQAGLDLGLGVVDRRRGLFGRPSFDPDPDQPGAIGRVRERHHRQRREKLGQMDYGPGSGGVSDRVLGGGGSGCPLGLDRADFVGVSRWRLDRHGVGIRLVPVGDGLERFLCRGSAHPARARTHGHDGRAVPVCASPWLCGVHAADTSPAATGGMVARY